MSEKLTARLVGGSGGMVTKVTEIALSAEKWYGGEGTWAQIVEAEGVSAFSKIDLAPSAEQLQLLQQLGITVMTENDGGIITVHAFGEKPTTDITLQATVTEVVRSGSAGSAKVYGSAAGHTVPLLYPKSR